MKRTSRRLLIPLTMLALVAAGCGSDSNDAAGTTAAPATDAPATTAAATTAAPATTAATTSTTPAVSGDITVFAAASLTDSFNAVGDAFTAANPDAKATFSFDASSALVQQITQGAPADVFASADTANMDKLTAASLNGTEPVIFATNLLQILRELRKTRIAQIHARVRAYCIRQRRGRAVMQIRRRRPHIAQRRRIDAGERPAESLATGRFDRADVEEREGVARVEVSGVQREADVAGTVRA